jgi:hypothetical protein
MPRRYLVTYEYTETVRGEPRDFIHETMIEAEDLHSANRFALDYFESLAIRSQVGWTRVLQRVEVTTAKPDAVAQGGRRVERERSIED